MFAAGTFGLSFTTSGGASLWGPWDIPRVEDAFRRVNHDWRVMRSLTTDVLRTCCQNAELATEMEVAVTSETRVSRERA